LKKHSRLKKNDKRLTTKACAMNLELYLKPSGRFFKRLDLPVRSASFVLEPAPPFRLDLTVWTLRRRPDKGNLPNANRVSAMQKPLAVAFLHP
jgi:hypothetical protein